MHLALCKGWADHWLAGHWGRHSFGNCEGDIVHACSPTYCQRATAARAGSFTGFICHTTSMGLTGSMSAAAGSSCPDSNTYRHLLQDSRVVPTLTWPGLPPSAAAVAALGGGGATSCLQVPICCSCHTAQVACCGLARLAALCRCCCRRGARCSHHLPIGAVLWRRVSLHSNLTCPLRCSRPSQRLPAGAGAALPKPLSAQRDHTSQTKATPTSVPACCPAGMTSGEATHDPLSGYTRFQLVRPISRGAFGLVVCYLDLRIQQSVAVKFIKVRPAVHLCLWQTSAARNLWLSSSKRGALHQLSCLLGKQCAHTVPPVGF